MNFTVDKQKYTGLQLTGAHNGFSAKKPYNPDLAPGEFLLQYIEIELRSQKFSKPVGAFKTNVLEVP